MSSLVQHPLSHIGSIAEISGAIVATMFSTYLILAYARLILHRIGPQGVDAVTRIVGFFVSAMGMGLIFHGLIDAIRQYGIMPKL